LLFNKIYLKIFDFYAYKKNFCFVIHINKECTNILIKEREREREREKGEREKKKEKDYLKDKLAAFRYSLQVLQIAFHPYCSSNVKQEQNLLFAVLAVNNRT